MIKINDYIYYIPKQQHPLSAEVFFIKKDENVYIYDVGNGKQYIDEINRQNLKKYIIISHFHPDHCFNIKELDNFNLYQSKNTAKYTKINEYQTQLDSRLKIYEIPSSHAKGCLVLEVDDYLFVGDALYANAKGLYNVNALNMQIRMLENSNIKYIVCSHREPLVQTKDDIIQELTSIYNQRNPKEAFIHKKY